MTVTAIQIGLHPDAVDYRISRVCPVHRAVEGEVDQGQQRQCRGAAGRRLRGRQLPHRDRRAGVETARKWLAAKRYDAVLIGAGVRLVASNTLLFEAIVNAAHAANPGCRFVFNYSATLHARRHPPLVPRPGRLDTGGVIMATSHSVDVVVIGAGPTGLTAAGDLATLRPLGRRPRTLARHEPVQPGLRHHGPHAGGARRPRSGRRRPRAGAPGTRCVHLRRCANRSDASAFGHTSSWRSRHRPTSTGRSPAMPSRRVPNIRRGFEVVALEQDTDGVTVTAATEG